MKTNFIIHQKARQYQWYGECFLSVKSFYGGKANYQVKQREYKVDKTNFLILNECTEYRLTIDSRDETESFCAFFAPEFVTRTISEIGATDEQLLDFNLKSNDGIKLFERNYIHNGTVSQLLKIGREKFTYEMQDLEKDEWYRQLLYAVLEQNSKSYYDTALLNLKRKSTREEIYRRLYFVKDYIDCNYSKNLRLSDLAAVGLLSENHLLRNFKKVFKITPFQYISRKRIQEAKRQILETDKNIKDIAIDVGYSSFGNFSSYFKRIIGESPIGLRKSDI
ncbi:AraC family transcriptional regulator [Aquimarina aggregata]|uniref:AraC family transcriptional regulator n=1 Tax=Aquimarina aggregata TaxID=1642818 RepID=UPI0024912BE1|nr:AraC family transcriptional regulator [Aquimarina aggregata]